MAIRCEHSVTNASGAQEIHSNPVRMYARNNDIKTAQLTAQTGEVKPRIAACIPSATKGVMFSPRRVSLYRALRMFRAWTCCVVNRWYVTTQQHNIKCKKYIQLLSVLINYQCFLCFLIMPNLKNSNNSSHYIRALGNTDCSVINSCREISHYHTWGTVEVSVFLSANGIARAISSLMVTFKRLQLEDLGSEESRAWRQWENHKHRPGSHEV